MDVWQNWLRRVFPADPGPDGGAGTPPKSRAWQFLLLAAAGVLLLVMSRFTPQTPEEQVQPAALGLPSAAAGGGQGDVEDLERRLERWLASMRNVGSVEVMITLDTTQTQVFALERTVERTVRREPGEGGEAEYVTTEERIVERPVVLRSDQGRSEAPLVVTAEMPAIRGVVVVAEGAYDPRIRYEIFQAVQTALGVPAHKVHVFAKE